MDLEESLLNEFERELSDSSLPTDTSQIVGRRFQFTTAIAGTPQGDRMSLKTPEVCLYEDAGIDLLAADSESLEASFCTPLTLIGTIIGVSYDSHLAFVVLHIQPLYLEAAGYVHALFVQEQGTARLIPEESSDKHAFLGKFKLL